jgi:hypothetical protein
MNHQQISPKCFDSQLRLLIESVFVVSLHEFPSIDVKSINDLLSQVDVLPFVPRKEWGALIMLIQ